MYTEEWECWCDEQDRQDVIALREACRTGDRQKVIELVAKGTAAFFKDERGMTALHYAAAHSSRCAEFVKLLCADEHAIRVNARNFWGVTPIHMCVRHGMEQAIDLLLKAGANINARDFVAKVPLHYATTTNRCRFLLELGADVNTADARGMSPLFNSPDRRFSLYPTVDDKPRSKLAGMPLANLIYWGKYPGNPLEAPAATVKLTEFEIIALGGKKMKYVTSSLYSAYYFWRKGLKTDDEFFAILRKEKTEPTESMKRGVAFEDAVRTMAQQIEQKTPGVEDEMEDMALSLRGADWQIKCARPIEIDGYGEILLYGVVDAVRQDTIFDVKCVRDYEYGQFWGQIQHWVYMYCCSLPRFKYSVYRWSDDKFFDCEEYFWSEDEGLDKLKTRVRDMLDTIYAHADWRDAFEENWRAEEKMRNLSLDPMACDQFVWYE